MTGSPPRLSIVLPSHDGLAHLDEAVESVLAQTEKDFELILVDDGSRDATGARMDEWAARDTRIRVLHLEPNRGLPAALNAGFAEARGELFTWTSDDNAYLPDALATMTAQLDDRPDLDLVYADYLRFETGGLAREVRVAPCDSLPFENGVGACFLYRREVHEELGGYDESLPLAEDYDFWLRAKARFRLEPLHRTLYRYRDHGRSLTNTRRGDVRRAAWRAVERHLPALSFAQATRVRLHWARKLQVGGHAGEARRSLSLALRQAPRQALAAPYRDVVLRGAFGPLGRRLVAPVADDALRLVVPGHLGGVSSWAQDLCALPSFQERGTRLVWLDGDTPGQSPAPQAEEDGQHHVAHVWPAENLFAVLRRLHRVLGRSRGAILASEFFGLAYGARFAGGAPIVQILHGDLPRYYELARRFEPWVDAYVAVSRRVADQARSYLPDRADDVFLHPNGVPVPTERTPRPEGDGSLRLVYAGRVDSAKGIRDLPAIDERLRRDGARIRWTVIGTGPDLDWLRNAFAAHAEVRFEGALPREACRSHIAEHDVLVLPSHAEGLPLALLEAMAAGVVPVVSDLPSGVREVVEDGVNGLLARPRHPEDFARAIRRLARSPELLADCGVAAAERVRGQHALEALAPALLDRIRDLEAYGARVRPAWRRGPSRLDRPWWPNAWVRGLRRWQR